MAVVGLALLAVVQLVTPNPSQVGNWRSAQGREDYYAAYGQVLQQWPKPSTTVDVPTRFGTVRAYEWAGTSPRTKDGTGAEPVVLIPGRTSGAPMWRDNLDDLVTQRHVIALDPLGDAGLSQQTVPLTSSADQSAWLHDVLEELSPDMPVHLVGHSFGGATAAGYAVDHPDRVASLTLLEPIFTLGSPPLSIYLWSALILLPTPQSWRDEALRRIGGTDDETQTGSAASQDPLAQMIDIGAREYSAKLPTPAVLDDSELYSLTMPVYVGIGGKNSLAGGEDAANRARTELPNPTVQVWPDATHSLPMQVGTDLNQELLQFWEAVE